MKNRLIERLTKRKRFVVSKWERGWERDGLGVSD